VAITFTCPFCTTTLTINDRSAGHEIGCPNCRERITVPGTVNAPTQPRPSQSAKRADRGEAEHSPKVAVSGSPGEKRNNPAARPRCGQPGLQYTRPILIRGEVVGLEKVREQYVRGSGYVEGSQVLIGSYHGADAVRHASGGVWGHGSISGRQETWTEYHYETNFFIRKPDGQDCPVRRAGEHLQLLDGHLVTAVVLRNDYDEHLLAAIVNHSTTMRHWMTTEDELVRFIGLSRRRRVRAQLMTPDERARELQSYRRKLNAYTPWLLGACFCGVALGLLGIIFLAGDHTAPGALMTMGGLALGLVAGLLWLLAYRHLLGIKNKPETETISVANRELQDELDAIYRFVRCLLSG
jgi:hypothetical protein